MVPQDMPKARTIHDVAKAAGLSIGSVSDILGGKMRYSYRQDTIDRVKNVAAELGYRPHSMASALRRRESTLVGIAVSEHLGPFINQIFLSLRREIMARELHPVLIEMPSDDLGQMPGRDLLAGLISIDLTMATDLSPASAALLEEIPAVALYPTRIKDLDCVTTDRARGIELAVDHLIELGHRRIAFAEQVENDSPVIAPKTQGWHAARRKHGIDPDGRYTISIPNGASERGIPVVEALTHMAEPPSALVCGSDDVALYVIGQLAGLGWKLPGNLSVVGFDGAFYGKFSCPPLTTIAHPHDQIARAGVDRLLTRIEASRRGDSLPPKQQLIAPSLLERASTCAFETWRPVTS